MALPGSPTAPASLGLPSRDPRLRLRPRGPRPRLAQLRVPTARGGPARTGDRGAGLVVLRVGAGLRTGHPQPQAVMASASLLALCSLAGDGPCRCVWAQFPVPAECPPRERALQAPPPAAAAAAAVRWAVQARSGLCLLHTCSHPVGEASAVAHPGAESRRKCVAPARAQTCGAVSMGPCCQVLRWSLLIENQRSKKKKENRKPKCRAG